MITIGGREYELKYNQKINRQIEAAMGGSGILEMVARSNGVLSSTALYNFIAFALFNDSGAKIGSVQGGELADEWVVQDGELPVTAVVLEALMRDCPFLFREN